MVCGRHGIARRGHTRPSGAEAPAGRRPRRDRRAGGGDRVVRMGVPRPHKRAARGADPGSGAPHLRVVRLAWIEVTEPEPGAEPGPGPGPEAGPEAAGRPTELASVSHALAAAGLRPPWLRGGPPPPPPLPHTTFHLSPPQHPSLRSWL